MSKGLVLSVLAILILLVAVMANIVAKPYVKEPPRKPTKAEIAAKAEMDKKQRLAEMAQRTNAAKLAAKPKPVALKPHGPGGKPAAVPSPGSMQIEENWWKSRKDGPQGIAEAQKEDAQRAAAPKATPQLTPMKPPGP